MVTHIARVVDEPGGVALHGGVHHGVVVDLEHVTAYAPGLVVLLSLVRQHGTDLLARVFYHHLPRLDLALAIQPTAVDARAVNTNGLLGVLGQVAEAHGHGQVERGGATGRGRRRRRRGEGGGRHKGRLLKQEITTCKI